MLLLRQQGTQRLEAARLGVLLSSLSSQGRTRSVNMCAILQMPGRTASGCRPQRKRRTALVES
eukprot:5254532-Amphidinium_carterae.1